MLKFENGRTDFHENFLMGRFAQISGAEVSGESLYLLPGESPVINTQSVAEPRGGIFCDDVNKQPDTTPMPKCIVPRQLSRHHRHSKRPNIKFCRSGQDCYIMRKFP
ncbi:hypothetical protein L798_00660 [Zootermopsis nevadensis]|uniref:Uncharacterized protein n=1 Tax=Zootermopsis nevadensis TaxID=136037 RepID=A0A067QK66_ZOONE|nr:hypothetical protein L798_00660 [Zootermopsis nevadensis]